MTAIGKVAPCYGRLEENLAQSKDDGESNKGSDFSNESLKRESLQRLNLEKSYFNIMGCARGILL